MAPLEAEDVCNAFGFWLLSAFTQLHIRTDFEMLLPSSRDTPLISSLRITMTRMLRVPSLGPIVGHATSTSTRVWIRGAEAGDHRTVGIAAIYPANSCRKTPEQSDYIRLHRDHDRTGVCDFTGLEPDTEYRVRMASLTLDSIDDDIMVDNQSLLERLPKISSWNDDLNALPADQSEAYVRTFPEAPSAAVAPLSFLFGSCRYPGLLHTKKSDRIFDALLRQFQQDDGSGKTPRFVMMVGDQIYADLLNRMIPFGLADTAEEFQDRYLKAFGSRNMRRLLRQAPTYMILDDHEIEDNWVQGRIKDSSKRLVFNYAISSYMNYQWCHSPRTYGKRLYYSFECAGHPFFVLDERTQRMRDDEDNILDDNHLLGIPREPHHHERYFGQVDVFCKWLADQQHSVKDAPKFVVSPSVFVPNEVTAIKQKGQKESDSWPAFPETRRMVLKTMIDNDVQNVVFLSGDIHRSNVAEMRFTSGSSELPIRAFSVTSSAFYWPFPFADGEPLSFVHDSTAAKTPDGFQFNTEQHGDVVMNYKAWDFEQEDNFTQVDYDPESNSISVRNFDKRGNVLGASNLQLVPETE